MDWKAILALALLAAPVAYCTVEETRSRESTRLQIEAACIEQRGELTFSGKCTFPEQ